MNTSPVSPNYQSHGRSGGGGGGFQSPGYNKKWKVSDSFKVTKLRVISKEEVQQKRDLKSNVRKDPTKTCDANSYLKSRREKARKERQGNILGILDENIERLSPKVPQHEKTYFSHRSPENNKKSTKTTRRTTSTTDKDNEHSKTKTSSSKQQRPVSPRRTNSKGDLSSASSSSSKHNRLRALNPFRNHGKNDNQSNNNNNSSSTRKGILKKSPGKVVGAGDDDTASTGKKISSGSSTTSPKHSSRSTIDRRSIRSRRRAASGGTLFSDDPEKDSEMKAILEDVLRRYPKKRCKTFADHQQYAFAELTTQSNHKKDIQENFNDLKSMLSSHLASTLQQEQSPQAPAAEDETVDESVHVVEHQHDDDDEYHNGNHGRGSSKSPTDQSKKKTKKSILRGSVGVVGDDDVRYDRSPKRNRSVDNHGPASPTTHHRSSKKKMVSTSSSPGVEEDGGGGGGTSKSLSVPLPRHLEVTSSKNQSIGKCIEEDKEKQLNESDMTLPTETTETEDDESILVPVVKLLIVDPAGHVGQYTGTICINTGKPHGSGRLEYEGGGSYQGDWTLGSWSGYGRHVKKNGDIYEGNFFDNTKHGMGCYRYRDGRRKFDGRYVMGQRVDGQMTYGDGSIYKGQWSDGKRHGRGTYKFKDGSLYKGEFFHDVIHGVGQLVWPDGAKYIGEWNQGHRHGMGKEYMSDGRLRYEGRWKESAPVS
jgi:MORN repeat